MIVIRGMRGDTMEIRKLQRTGGATFIVSLPKDWVNINKLTAGDCVSLRSMPNGALLVENAEEDRKKDKRDVWISDEPSGALLRKLIAIYMVSKGITTIKCKDRLTKKQRQDIKDFVHRVIGTEIVEETANTVTIQDMIDTGELSIGRGFRRMALIATSMFNDAAISLREQDRDIAEDILLRDDDVDRLYWLICKQFYMLSTMPQLSAKMEMMPLDASFYLAAAKNIERIADHSCRIANNIIEMKNLDKAIASKIADATTPVSEMIEDSVSALLRKEFDMANDVIESMRTTTSACQKLLSKIPTKRKETVNLAYIVESIERVASYSTDIAEIAINMTALPSSK